MNEAAEDVLVTEKEVVVGEGAFGPFGDERAGAQVGNDAGIIVVFVRE